MFPVTITLHDTDQLQRVMSVLYTTTPVPKSAAASDASGPATAKDGAAPTKTVKDKDPTAGSAAAKSQASTAADTKKTGESAAAPAQNAAQAPADTTGSTDVAFGTVRELVLKLAGTHREGVKAINVKHGIPKLGALLSDENDYGSVIDQPKLNAIYADLQRLGA
ncbi:hypothetical protein AAKU67_002231 [Oxalobacteraceae bacterium GrIS 2.11]